MALDNTSGRLRIGMFVTVAVPLRGASEVRAAAVPDEALQKISGGNNQLPLTISADANARHQFVVTAMDVAGRLGFTQVNIATVNDVSED